MHMPPRKALLIFNISTVIQEETSNYYNNLHDIIV